MNPPKVEEALEHVRLPDFVVDKRFNLGLDSTGEKAVWVWIVLSDEAPELTAGQVAGVRDSIRRAFERARHLARKEPQRPRQASLRRAVSAAYYGLFHLLVEEASKSIATGPALAGVRHLTSRTFVHGEMKEASKSFAGGTLPDHVKSALPGFVIPSDLLSVADAFQELQQARHEADYDTSRRFTRQETQALLAQVEQAYQSWKPIRSMAEAKTYLHAIFSWNKWRK